jgi:hypothetical protein
VSRGHRRGEHEARRVAKRRRGRAARRRGRRARLPVAREERRCEHRDGRDERRVDDAGGRSIPTTRRVTFPPERECVRLPRRFARSPLPARAARASVWASDRPYAVNSFANIPTVASRKQYEAYVAHTFSHIIMRVLFFRLAHEKRIRAVAPTQPPPLSFAPIGALPLCHSRTSPTRTPRLRLVRVRLARLVSSAVTFGLRRPERHLERETRRRSARDTSEHGLRRGRGWALRARCGHPRRLHPDASVS